MMQTDANLNCALDNAGIPITTPLINNDLTGLGRSSTNPDLGAYEYAYLAPVQVASNDGPKCVGGNINLGITPGNGVAPFNYSWNGPNSFASTDQNPVLSNVTGFMSGAYMVTLTDANGCTGSAQTTLALNALPAGTLNSNPGNIVIPGSPVSFIATDGSSYNFKVNGKSVQNSASATYTSSSLHTGDIVTVITGNLNGCSATYPGITMKVSAVMINGKKYAKWNGSKIKNRDGIKKGGLRPIF